MDINDTKLIDVLIGKIDKEIHKNEHKNKENIFFTRIKEDNHININKTISDKYNNFINNNKNKCNNLVSPITPFLIHILITHIRQYISKINNENIKLIDFGTGAGFLSHIIQKELPIDIVSLDINHLYFPIDKCEQNILLISWDFSLRMSNESIYKILKIYNPKLVIIIGDIGCRSLSYKCIIEKSIEYIDYFIIDPQTVDIPNKKKSLDEKISFNLLYND